MFFCRGGERSRFRVDYLSVNNVKNAVGTRRRFVTVVTVVAVTRWDRGRGRRRPRRHCDNRRWSSAHALHGGALLYAPGFWVPSPYNNCTHTHTHAQHTHTRTHTRITHTHTHGVLMRTNVYKYLCVCVCVCMFTNSHAQKRRRRPDQPLPTTTGLVGTVNARTPPPPSPLPQQTVPSTLYVVRVHIYIVVVLYTFVVCVCMCVRFCTYLMVFILTQTHINARKIHVRTVYSPCIFFKTNFSFKSSR